MKDDAQKSPNDIQLVFPVLSNQQSVRFTSCSVQSSKTTGQIAEHCLDIHEEDSEDDYKWFK